MNDLFIKRTSRDTAFIEVSRKVLDKWAGAIPFSPIKSFSSQTEFVRMEEYAIYRIEVSTQEEIRSFVDHTEPYRGEKMPTFFRPKTDFNLWKIDFTRFADFEEHKQSKVIIPTRRFCSCGICHASGRIKCDSCAGKGKLICGMCSGSGNIKCSRCSGGGHIEQTRLVEKRRSCSFCNGRGRMRSSNARTCNSCGGRGESYHNVPEQYYDPCTSCATSGKVDCSRCGGGGQVTCSPCSGSGDRTCVRCMGRGSLLSYTTVERTELPHRANEVLIPSALPKFKTTKSPISVLKGSIMFTQDEPHALVSLPLNGQEAASVIQASFLKCRHVVSGRIIRQKLTIARCIITSWSYKHQDKNLIIYVNPAQGLVEDIDGPIRKHIEVVALLAAEMYNAGRYEQSFTANQKVICMSEVTENSESLRMSIFKKLGIHYLAWALIGWGASCAFIRVVFVGTTLTAGLPFTFLGLLPLVCGVWIFSRDIGLSFRNPRSRIPVGLLIGILACISGVAERHSILLSVLLGWAVVALIRSRERERRAKIESHLEALGGVLALEKYLEDFSQKKGVARLSMVILSAACLLTFFLGKIQFP